MGKKIFIAAGFLVFILAILLLIGGERGEIKKSVEESMVSSGLALEVEAVLSEKIALISELVKTSEVIDEVKISNEKSGGLSLNEILKLDQRWRQAEGIDDFIRPFLINIVALKLIEFQKTHPEFPEIFITDAYGLNVGQTNKTTDFYQADEQWWVDAYNEGRGKAFYGEIEFDESAHAEAIALYVPVMDPKTNESVGVTKAILDIAAIKAGL